MRVWTCFSAAMRRWAKLKTAAAFLIGSSIVLAACDTPCDPVEVLDVNVGGMRLSIPAKFEPWGDPKDALRSMTVGSQNAPTYCRTGSTPVLHFLSFHKRAYEDALRLDGMYRLLPQAYPVSLRGAPSDDVLPPIELGAPFTAFIRSQRSERMYDLKSEGPALFGRGVEANCSRINETGDLCTIRGRAPAGQFISIDVTLDKIPLTDWPVLFQEMEKFLNGLMSQTPQGK